jgi:hypothetical protein
MKSEKKDKNLYWDYPEKFAGLIQNHEKIIGAKIFPSKTLFGALIVTKNQKFIWKLSDEIYPGATS